MDKRGGIIIALVIIIALFLVWFIVIPLVELAVKEIMDEREYRKFCEERPDFCYCGITSCSFRTKYINGNPTKETREFCELSEELKNEEMLFQGDCRREGGGR